MRRLKLYIDTSVWNFYYADDSPEKMEDTKRFFEEIEICTPEEVIEYE